MNSDIVIKTHSQLKLRVENADSWKNLRCSHWCPISGEDILFKEHLRSHETAMVSLQFYYFFFFLMKIIRFYLKAQVQRFSAHLSELRQLSHVSQTDKCRQKCSQSKLHKFRAGRRCQHHRHRRHLVQLESIWWVIFILFLKRIEFKFWLFIFIDGDNADVLLGSLDSAFLFSYAFGMYLM